MEGESAENQRQTGPDRCWGKRRGRGRLYLYLCRYRGRGCVWRMRRTDGRSAVYSPGLCTDPNYLFYRIRGLRVVFRCSFFRCYYVQSRLVSSCLRSGQVRLTGDLQNVHSGRPEPPMTCPNLVGATKITFTSSGVTSHR